MLGKDLFRVENNVDLSNERFKSLVLFYIPLIGNDAHYLYEYLIIKGNSFIFNELNKLLNSINFSIDRFEDAINKLNQYRLIKTYKEQNEDKYIFVLNDPLSLREFIKDDLFVRDFILKTSGLYYQSIISEIIPQIDKTTFKDISTRYEKEELGSWSDDYETFLKPVNKQNYDFNTMFDINTFLKDISTVLLPLKYRSEENLKEIADLADLYNISYDKMRSFIPKVCRANDNSFDFTLLKNLCQNAITDYQYVEEGLYDIPCKLFLMNKQDGKEVSPYDQKIIYNLAHDYHLKPSVINVLLEHGLKNCDNRLIEKYLYPIASDLHRNNIENYSDALKRLDSSTNKNKKVEEPEVYDDSANPVLSKEELERLLARRNNHD